MYLTCLRALCMYAWHAQTKPVCARFLADRAHLILRQLVVGREAWRIDCAHLQDALVVLKQLAERMDGATKETITVAAELLILLFAEPMMTPSVALNVRGVNLPAADLSQNFERGLCLALTSVTIQTETDFAILARMARQHGLLTTVLENLKLRVAGQLDPYAAVASMRLMAVLTMETQTTRDRQVCAEMVALDIPRAAVQRIGGARFAEDWSTTTHRDTFHHAVASAIECCRWSEPSALAGLIGECGLIEILVAWTIDLFTLEFPLGAPRLADVPDIPAVRAVTSHLCCAVSGLSQAVEAERSLQAPVRERLLPVVSTLAERLRPAVQRQNSRGLLPEVARIDRDGLIALT